MKEISRELLFGKLNRLAYDAIERATDFSEIRGNPFVELVHWIHQILGLQDSDMRLIIRDAGLNEITIERDIVAALSRLPRGAAGLSDISYHVMRAVERGWVYATLMFGAAQVRTGHVLFGMLKEPGLRSMLLEVSSEFGKISIEHLSDSFDKITEGSPEEAMPAMNPTAPAMGQPPEAVSAARPQLGRQEALTRFSVDLTQRARDGELDPIIGRDPEIRQIVDILMRRRQNNPILTGEAGVGKTAVVEGFALRIAAGDVPPALRGVTLRALDLGLLQAGAGVRGEFENRLRQVIEEVQASPVPIILFIDEVHMLIGAGGASGTADAANLLKPALARGTLRTIGATTWAEYKRYFEDDAALTRRFQVVKVDEPGEDAAVLMLRGLTSTLEQHHRVQILDEALDASVKLSRRYVPARQLPDKAVSVLDTAAARVAVSLHGTPAEVESCQHRLQSLETEAGIIQREKAVGIDTAERQAAVEKGIASERSTLETLNQRWETEKQLVDQILQLRSQLRGVSDEVEGASSPVSKAAETPAAIGGAETHGSAKSLATPTPLSEKERKALLERLQSLQQELSALQGEAPLILPTVDGQVIASVIADWTGIPIRRMVKDEIKAVLDLPQALQKRVLGQDHALRMIAKRIQTTRTSLDNPDKPIGVFLLCGPSGVGKTETGLALAEALYGGEENIVTINMSEFQEKHTVSTLKGAPPGYVGYGKGGVLTEAVRRRPYSVVLLDEVEKAHRDVHEIFFQVFDKGRMEDAEGRGIDFRNTLILLTSNVGTEVIMRMCADPERLPQPEVLAEALRKPLLQVFPPALLGRLVVVPYYSLSDAMLNKIIRLQLDRIDRRISKQLKIPFTYDDAVVDSIARRCTEVESGARAVDAILTNTVLPEISQEILTRRLDGGKVTRVHVGVKNDALQFEFD